MYWPEFLFILMSPDFIQTAGFIGGAASSLIRVPTEVVQFAYSILIVFLISLVYVIFPSILGL